MMCTPSIIYQNQQQTVRVSPVCETLPSPIWFLYTKRVTRNSYLHIYGHRSSIHVVYDSLVSTIFSECYKERWDKRCLWPPAHAGLPPHDVIISRDIWWWLQDSPNQKSFIIRSFAEFWMFSLLLPLFFNIQSVQGARREWMDERWAKRHLSLNTQLYSTLRRDKRTARPHDFYEKGRHIGHSEPHYHNIRVLKSKAGRAWQIPRLDWAGDSKYGVTSIGSSRLSSYFENRWVCVDSG